MRSNIIINCTHYLNQCQYKQLCNLNKIVFLIKYATKKPQ